MIRYWALLLVAVAVLLAVTIRAQPQPGLKLTIEMGARTVSFSYPAAVGIACQEHALAIGQKSCAALMKSAINQIVAEWYRSKVIRDTGSMPVPPMTNETDTRPDPKDPQ